MEEDGYPHFCNVAARLIVDFLLCYRISETVCSCSVLCWFWRSSEN